MYSHKASHAPLINRQLSVCFPLCYFFLSLLFLTDRLYEISSYYNHVQFFCQERKFCDYLYALWELWAGELILTFYTLLRTFHYVDEGISSSFPFIYPRKQTIGFLFNFIYALSGASWLTRGYRHPVLHSHTLLLHATNFPEGTASTFDFNIPFSHLTSDINKKAQSNSSQMESSALCLGNWLFFYEFILLLKWNFPCHGAFRVFFPCPL